MKTDITVSVNSDHLAYVMGWDKTLVRPLEIMSPRTGPLKRSVPESARSAISSSSGIPSSIPSSPITLSTSFLDRATNGRSQWETRIIKETPTTESRQQENLIKSNGEADRENTIKKHLLKNKGFIVKCMPGAHIFGKDEFSSAGQAVKSVLAEIVGTGALVLFGCGACLPWGGSFAPATPLQIAIAFGFVIASMVQTIGHVSGCNINPAVTVGLLASGRIGLVRAALYIPAQCVGAMGGAALLFLVSPSGARGNLGTATLGSGVTPWQGALVEGIVSCLLLLVVCAVTDPNRLDVGNAAPVAIGLAITTSHIFAIPFTGSSMNPARALGPAVFSAIWDNHWVYWVGPLIGGAIGGIIYRMIFSAAKDEESSYDL